MSVVYISDRSDPDIEIKCNHSKLLHCRSADVNQNTAIQGWSCQRMLCWCECTVCVAVVLVNGENSLPLCVRSEFIVPAWTSRVAAPCTWRIVGAIWGRDRCMLGCFFSAHCACTAVWLTQWMRNRNVCVWVCVHEVIDGNWIIKILDYGWFSWWREQRC